MRRERRQSGGAAGQANEALIGDGCSDVADLSLVPVPFAPLRLYASAVNHFAHAGHVHRQLCAMSGPVCGSDSPFISPQRRGGAKSGWGGSGRVDLCPAVDDFHKHIHTFLHTFAVGMGKGTPALLVAAAAGVLVHAGLPEATVGGLSGILKSLRYTQHSYLEMRTHEKSQGAIFA